MIGAGCVLVLAASAQAQLYKCTNATGKVSGYVSSPAECAGSGYQKVPTYEPSAKDESSAKTPAAAPSAPPPKTPQQAGAAPQKRAQYRTALDKKRGTILLYELNSEHKMLAAMNQAIAETTPDNNSYLSVLQLQRREHTLNIIALQRELKKLGIDAGNSGN